MHQEIDGSIIFREITTVALLHNAIRNVIHNFSFPRFQICAHTNIFALINLWDRMADKKDSDLCSKIQTHFNTSDITISISHNA